jgi:type VI protein secretion system component VasK
MPVLDFLWAMLWFFLFIAWIWVVIVVIADVFRSHDLNGWGKALWTIFIILIPWLGVLVYLIARGHGMQERQMQQAADQQAAANSYIQQAAGTTSADQLEKLKGLHDSGALTDDEYAAQKAKVLNS